MVRLFSATHETFPDLLPLTGVVSLCLAMLVFCVAGSLLSTVLVSIARAKLCWTWVSASVCAWVKAFAGFLFLYAIQIVDKQNGDLGYAHFVLVGLAAIGLLLFELDAAADRETYRLQT